MNNQEDPPRLGRRRFIALGGGGLLLAGIGGIAATRVGAGPTTRLASPRSTPQQAAVASPSLVRLVATDGFMSYPGRRTGPAYPGDLDDSADGVYSFGFRGPSADDVAGGDPFTAPIGELVDLYKGRVTNPAPILAVGRDADVYMTMTNLGFELRPDLDDAHSVHWHGFRQQIAIFDGVPESGIAVPPLRDFPYYFLPRDAGTYIYHCHFEDTEHVQMGMDGVIFVRPAQDLAPLSPGERYAYDDGDGSTAFDREFALLLNEIDLRPHDNLVLVQEFVWSEYDPSYYVINGRAYPDTVLPHDDPSLPLQPVSSLVQGNEGERILIRMANLGFQQHSMQLAGLPLQLVGADATLLRGPTGADLSYETNTVDCGPGETRDLIFVAPPHSTGNAADGPDVYLFRNRNLDRLVNGPSSADLAPNGLGGMVTEVHIYPPGTLGPQGMPSQLVGP